MFTEKIIILLGNLLGGKQPSVKGNRIKFDRKFGDFSVRTIWKKFNRCIRFNWSSRKEYIRIFV